MNERIGNRFLASTVNNVSSLATMISRIVLFVFLSLMMMAMSSIKDPAHLKQTIIWKINDTTGIGGMRPAVLGKPQIVHEGPATALFFDGMEDGLILPANPLQGWKKFTIEILFKPEEKPSAPRMIHLQDEEGNRCTIELRITPEGQWYLDSFLKNGKANQGCTLSDSLKLYRCDRWYWAALVYDGNKMMHYVNAVMQGEGSVSLPTMIRGQIAIGVRLNKVNWFKGQIQEIRFHSTALKATSLQRL